MTDVSTGEMPTELVPSIPPPPDAAIAPAQAEAPAGDAGDVETESFDPRVEIPETLGPVRRSILDGLIDSEVPLSVAKLHELMPVGTPKGTAEAAILREYRSGRIIRTSPGHYVLAPSKAPGPPQAAAPEPDPVRTEGIADEQWFALLDIWTASARWEGPGNPPGPGQAGCLVPAGIIARHTDRLRKRQQRAKDAEAAATKRAEADAALRNKLIAGCFNNLTPGAGIQDLAPIRAMLADGVPLDHVLIGLMRRTDRRIDPQATPISSWREERFLESVARAVLLGGLLPQLVQGWKAAGIAPTKPAGAAEASLAVQVPPEPESAPAPSPANGAAPPGGDEIGPSAAALLNKFGQTDVQAAAPPNGRPPVAGRDAVMAALSRGRTPPQPPRPVERPWFAGPEAPQPTGEMTDDAWRFVLEGYAAGNVAWAAKHGPPPRVEGCRAPRHILREFGF